MKLIRSLVVVLPATAALCSYMGVCDNAKTKYHKKIAGITGVDYRKIENIREGDLNRDGFSPDYMINYKNGELDYFLMDENGRHKQVYDIGILG